MDVWKGCEVYVIKIRSNHYVFVTSWTINLNGS
jgi:hypothetical protein